MITVRTPKRGSPGCCRKTSASECWLSWGLLLVGCWNTVRVNGGLPWLGTPSAPSSKDQLEWAPGVGWSCSLLLFSFILCPCINQRNTSSFIERLRLIVFPDWKDSSWGLIYPETFAFTHYFSLDGCWAPREVCTLSCSWSERPSCTPLAGSSAGIPRPR